MSDFENKDDLIAKVLSGEANAEEVRALESWRGASADNEEHFHLSKKLFDAMASGETFVEVNTDDAWNRLSRKIGEEEDAKIIPLQRRFTPLRVAASVALLIILGFVAARLFNTKPAEPLMIMASKERVERRLPDGSHVFLNKNTEISYVKNKDNVREVKLKGEAFFEVVHDPRQPFIITVGDVVIRDIGTAFNVKAVPGTSLVEVFVESGEVQFSTTNAAGLVLAKGEAAEYNVTSGTFKKQAAAQKENAVSYRTKVFSFRNTSLQDVIDQINAVYDSDIRLDDPKLGLCKLSVSFNNETLDMIVSIIADTLDLEVQRSGNTILLKGTSCNE